MSRMRSVVDAAKRRALQQLPWVLAYASGAGARGLAVSVDEQRFAIIDRASKRQIWLSRAHGVYVRDLVRYFDYYHGSVEPSVVTLGDHSYRVVDFSTSRFHMVAGFPHFPIFCPSLAEPYQTCAQYLEFAQLGEGQVALDLGCYSGLTSIAFSERVGRSGRVVSVEPDPTNRRACVRNLDLHRKFSGLDNVTLLPVAVAGRIGTASFSAESSMGSSEVSIGGGYRGETIEVPCVTLERLARDQNLARIDFVKMDIEGSEIDVIRASAAFFQAYRPRLIIEPHVVDGTLSDRAIISLLSSYGYTCRTIVQLGVSVPLVTAVPA